MHILSYCIMLIHADFFFHCCVYKLCLYVLLSLSECLTDGYELTGKISGFVTTEYLFLLSQCKEFLS